MNSSLQPQSDLLSGLQLQSPQPTVLTNQYTSGGMQGQFLNSRLLVQPQTGHQPVLIESQSLTPSKPLITSAKSTSGLIADGTPLHQVAIANKTKKNLQIQTINTIYYNVD